MMSARDCAITTPEVWHHYYTPNTMSTPVQTRFSTNTVTSPSSNYLKTPMSTLASAPGLFQPGHARQRKVSPIVTAETALQTFCFNYRRQVSRRVQKEKFEDALKANGHHGIFIALRTELAVQRLADIWKETSYVIHSTSSPSSSWTAVDSETARSNMPVRCHPVAAQQLPSPSTPTSHTFTSPLTFSLPPSTSSTSLQGIPLRPFIHELLRRSCIVWPTLQIALCYLDAAKSTISDAITEAKQNSGLQVAEAALDKLFGSASANNFLGPSDIDFFSTEVDTSMLWYPAPLATPVQSADADWIPITVPETVETASCSNSTVIQPIQDIRLLSLPSPLLCPRRMLIAALSLAMKFTQDQGYSNHVWAKISGLDVQRGAREIGRCERALGEALEWRLWVGKGGVDEAIGSLYKFFNNRR